MRVRDNGIGLRADTLERVFDMFEQVDRSYAQVTGGLGIGLTLVKRLVEAQGGSVRAESEGLGKGSVFSFRLSLTSSASGAAAAASGGMALAGASSARRILVADDNQDAATSLAMVLEMAGHETRVATDGAKAVAIAMEFRPHVVMLDIAMPVMDGLEAAREIRALPGGDAVLLLAISGFGQDADRRRSIEAGFDEHLVKPVDLARIDALLEKGVWLRRYLTPIADWAAS